MSRTSFFNKVDTKFEGSGSNTAKVVANVKARLRVLAKFVLYLGHSNWVATDGIN